MFFLPPGDRPAAPARASMPSPATDGVRRHGRTRTICAMTQYLLFNNLLAARIPLSRERPPATRLPPLLRLCGQTSELFACRGRTRRHSGGRRPPHPHAGEPYRRRIVYPPPPQCAAQPPWPRLLAGDPAHTRRHPEHHKAPRRWTAASRPIGSAVAQTLPRRESACNSGADVP